MPRFIESITLSRIFFSIILISSLVAAYFIMSSYLAVSALAIITAVLFRPTYLWFYKIFRKRDGISKTFTMLVFSFFVVVPLVFIAILTVNQMIVLGQELQNVDTSGLSLQGIADFINNFIGGLPFVVDYTLTVTQIQTQITSIAGPIGEAILENALSLGGSTIEAITQIVVYFTVFVAMLSGYPQVVEFIRSISPFRDEIDDLYIKRVEALSVSMVRGIFIVALIQSALVAISFALTGVPYVIFFFIISFVFALIPLGTGFVSFPVGIMQILFGNVWGGIFVMLFSAIVVSNVDNIIRPRLVSKEAHIHPVLTLLGILGGLQVFGFYGLFFGPIILIMLLTSLEVYKKYFKPETITNISS